VNGIDLDLEEETSNGVSVSSCALHLHLGCNFLSKVNSSALCFLKRLTFLVFFISVGI
jgi:hypothetical protein